MSMIDAYQIGVNLMLGGDLVPSIEKLIPALAQLNEAVKSANAEAKGLASALAGVGRSAPGIARAAEAMERLHAATLAAHQASQEFASGGGASSGPAAPSAPNAAPARFYPPALIAPRPQAQLPPPNSSGRGLAILQGNGGAGSGGAPPPINLFPNGYSPLPGGGGSGGGGRGPGSLRYTEAYNAFLMAQGALHGVEGFMRPAIDLERTTEVLSSDMRLSPEEIRGAVARARETSRLAPGTETGENMASLLDLKGLFGSLDEASKMLPEFAKMTVLFRTLDRNRGGRGDQSFAAAKAMEILGELTTEQINPDGTTTRRMDPEAGMDHLRMMERVAVASNMRVDPKTYLAFAKSARVAGMTLDNQFLFQQLPAILETEGGPRTGTAMMSMAQLFRGQKLTDQSAEAMVQLGLAGGDAVEYHVGGHMTNGVNGPARMVGGRTVIHYDKIYDLDTMQHNPLAYVQGAEQRMDAAGIHGATNQMNALMRASQRSTVAGMLALILKDVPPILKAEQNVVNTNPNTVDRMQDTSAAKVQQLQAAMHNLLTDLGSAALGDTAKALEAMTAALNKVGQWAHDNPEGARAALGRVDKLS